METENGDAANIPVRHESKCHTMKDDRVTLTDDTSRGMPGLEGIDSSASIASMGMAYPELQLSSSSSSLSSLPVASTRAGTKSGGTQIMKTNAKARRKRQPKHKPPSHAMFQKQIQISAILAALSFSWLLLNFITICAYVALLIMCVSFALVSWVSACYIWHMLKTGEFVTWLPSSAQDYLRNAVVHETLCKGFKGASISSSDHGVVQVETKEHSKIIK